MIHYYPFDKVYIEWYMHSKAFSKALKISGGEGEKLKNKKSF